MSGVVLRRWTDEDLPVLQRSNTEEMTRYLGGPESNEKLLQRQVKNMRLWEAGEAHMFTVNTSWSRVPVGSVGYWKASNQNRDIYEAGWSIATQFQGRGLASNALEACILDAAAQNDRNTLFAFPRIDNVASNALCRRVGLIWQSEEDFEYPVGVPIRVNAWSVEQH
ncbi:GNAT family N-acetyltransferase [Arthrobacter sp. H20]|uniref:GNAT family N-acetyltransferase n=1 Tax=Arthrobacter sp. H20 TaxID=1267981 RepID=UPI0005637522|nr:GNAT family N-acetyltransferase [Arthrobacter sp. H20]